MLELSPEETAAKPSAVSIPASTRTSRSKPTPLTVRPVKSGPSRRNASTSTSITATVWPRFSSERARVEPTRPQPMITMCTRASVGESRSWVSWLESLLVVHVSELGKRLLIGRKLSSTQLGETLLPKRIALPVFASDALSSVAYAPDEILITLSLAGLAAYAFSWKIAILVAVVMLVVVASYRQNVHAYPSGGGDYEVATVNLGPNAGPHGGQRPARRLRPHRRRVDLLRRAERQVGAAAALPGRPRGARRQHRRRGARRAEPARGAGVRRPVRRPDLLLHGRHAA